MSILHSLYIESLSTVPGEYDLGSGGIHDHGEQKGPHVSLKAYRGDFKTLLAFNLPNTRLVADCRWIGKILQEIVSKKL